MSFFGSLWDHSGSHLDQVYDSPPAYFWCVNPGVVEGTLCSNGRSLLRGHAGPSSKVPVLRSRSALQCQTYLEIAPRDLYSMWDRIRYSCV